MKKLQNLVFIIILVFASGCKEQMHKDTIAPKVEDITPLTDEDVKGVLEAFNTALINADKKVLEEICAEQLTYGHSSGLIQNKVEFIDDLVNGPFDFKSVSSPELTIQISEKTAIARFIFLAKAIKDDETVTIRLGCIQVFQQQENGKLKLLARQGYKLPNPDSNK